MRQRVKQLMGHPLISGSAVMMGGAMVSNVLNYVYHLVMGRMLGPEDYGVLASIFSIFYITGIVPTSTSIAIVKFVSAAQDREHLVVIYRKLRRFVFYLSIVLAGLMVLATPAVREFLQIEEMWPVLLVGPVLFFTLAILVNQATMQGLLKFWGYVGPNIVASVVKLLAGVGLVILGWSVLGAVAGVLLSMILAFVYSERMVVDLVRAKGSGSFDLGPFLKYAAPVLLQALAFTSLFTTDLILVKHFFSPFEAGLYASLSMLGKIIFFAAQPVASVMFPIVSGRRAKGEKYGKVLFSAIGMTVVITVAALSFYFMFPELAIRMLYGSAYLAATPGLLPMGLFISFYTVCSLIVNFFLSIGKTKIVILPLVACVLQALAIWFVHGSIWQVINLSLWLTGGMFIILLAVFGYNWQKER